MKTKTDTAKAPVEILIVEDSQTQAEKLRYTLESNGYRIRHAKNGKQAMDYLNGYHPALVISDIVMPQMNGYELCKNIKSNEFTRDIPVILMTSLTGTEDVMESLACGADSFITKPYSESYLLTQVEGFFGSKLLHQKESIQGSIDIILTNQHRKITVDPQRMLNLLLSTYEAAIEKNKELIGTQDELVSINENLEDIVKEKTIELVTENKKLQKYQILAKAANDIMLFIDEAGNILDVNSAATRCYGYNYGEFLRKNILDLRHISNKELVNTQLKAAIAGNIVFETIHYRKDNTTFFVEVSSQGVLLNGQKIIFSIIRDITERKHSEELLHDHEERYRVLSQTSIDGFYIADTDGRLWEVNDAYSRMSGYSIEELLSMNISELEFKETNEEIIIYSKKIIYDGFDRFETQHRKADGTLYDVQSSVAYIAGKGLFLCFVSDITKRKRAELEIKYERNMAQMYLDTVGVMIIALDKDGKINLINRAGCEILNVAKEDILGKDWFASYVPDYALQEEKQVFDKIVTSGIITEQYHENDVITANGEERRILWHNNPLRDTAGNIIGLLSSGTDITERKQSEAKIAHLASFPRFNPEPIVEINQDGSLNYANPTAKNIFSDLESVGIRHPFLLNWQTAVKQLLTQGNVPLVREIMVGDCIYSQTFQYIESSKTIRIYSQNITSRKQAENALMESENLFRTSFESATAGIAMFGKNEIFTIVNDRACELWGYTREELLQKAFSDITYEDDKEIGMDFVRKMIPGELNNAVFEKRYVKKDKTVIWALVSISAIRDNNNMFKHFITYIQDITESKVNAERINRTLEGTIETLALVVEAKDPYTSGHQKRVADIAVAIAENLGLSEGQVRGLYLASIVHDLGKIQVPAEILNKPGKLTNIEFELIKCHPEAAYNLLKNIDFPWPIAEIIYQHHERIDGSGYPRKLKGDSILIEAKILCVADVFEAMSSHRPYRAAFPVDVALAEIEKYKGVYYDTDVVEACGKIIINK